jgi:hypothetical protein
MLENGVYDLGLSRYVPSFLRISRRLREQEKKERAALMEKSRALFTRYRVPMVTVAAADGVTDAAIELFARYRDGFLR